MTTSFTVKNIENCVRYAHTSLQFSGAAVKLTTLYTTFGLDTALRILTLIKRMNSRQNFSKLNCSFKERIYAISNQQYTLYVYAYIERCVYSDHYLVVICILFFLLDVFFFQIEHSTQ